jgi:hypothetical protein
MNNATNSGARSTTDRRSTKVVDEMGMFHRLIAACLGVTIATGAGLVVMVILTAGGTIPSILLVVYFVGGLVGWLAYVKTGWPFKSK